MNPEDITVAFGNSKGKRMLQEDSLTSYHNVPLTRQYEQERGSLFVVADGMGGHYNGAFASRTATQEFKRYYTIPRQQELQLDSFLLDIVCNAHRKIQKEGERYPRGRKPGTTLSALLLTDQAKIIHCGDSRIYRITETTNELLTQDDTERFEGKTYVTEFLGKEDGDLHLQRIKLPYASGDYFIVCSDGLTAVNIEGRELQEIVKKLLEPKNIVEEILTRVRIRGEPDNASVIVVEIN